jgi:hypothetical protein
MSIIMSVDEMSFEWFLRQSFKPEPNFEVIAEKEYRFCQIWHVFTVKSCSNMLNYLMKWLCCDCCK